MVQIEKDAKQVWKLGAQNDKLMQEMSDNNAAIKNISERWPAETFSCVLKEVKAEKEAKENAV